MNDWLTECLFCLCFLVVILFLLCLSLMGAMRMAINIPFCVSFFFNFLFLHSSPSSSCYLSERFSVSFLILVVSAPSAARALPIPQAGPSSALVCISNFSVFVIPRFFNSQRFSRRNQMNKATARHTASELQFLQHSPLKSLG